MSPSSHYVILSTFYANYCARNLVHLSFSLPSHLSVSLKSIYPSYSLSSKCFFFFFPNSFLTLQRGFSIILFWILHKLYPLSDFFKAFPQFWWYNIFYLSTFSIVSNVPSMFFFVKSLNNIYICSYFYTYNVHSLPPREAKKYEIFPRTSNKIKRNKYIF